MFLYKYHKSANYADCEWLNDKNVSYTTFDNWYILYKGDPENWGYYVHRYDDYYIPYYKVGKRTIRYNDYSKTLEDHRHYIKFLTAKDYRKYKKFIKKLKKDGENYENLAELAELTEIISQRAHERSKKILKETQAAIEKNQDLIKKLTERGV